MGCIIVGAPSRCAGHMRLHVCWCMGVDLQSGVVLILVGCTHEGISRAGL